MKTLDPRSFAPKLVLSGNTQNATKNVGRPCCGGSCIGGNCKATPVASSLFT